MKYNPITLAIKKEGIQGFYRRNGLIIPNLIRDVDFIEDTLHHLLHGMIGEYKSDMDEDLKYFTPSEFGFIAVDVDNQKVIELNKNPGSDIGKINSYNIMKHVVQNSGDYINICVGVVDPEMVSKYKCPDVSFKKRKDGDFDYYISIPIPKGVEAFYDKERTEAVQFREFYEEKRIKCALEIKDDMSVVPVDLNNSYLIDIIREFCPAWKVRPDFESFRLQATAKGIRRILINYDFSPFEIEKYDIDTCDLGLERLMELGFNMNEKLKSDWLRRLNYVNSE
ncbi:hypothetical protein KY321_02215 [Candidatus Woesearchaeota archaeon]|nr:hypothetical protein [Candidatus Woesearchaeota archaeon]